MKIQEWISFQSKRVFPTGTSKYIKMSCKNLVLCDSTANNVSLNKICDFLLNKVKSN